MQDIRLVTQSQFAPLCAAQQTRFFTIDARNIEAYPEAFLAAPAISVGLPPVHTLALRNLSPDAAISNVGFNR
ncbi:hypothetical protein [Caldilinea sp.]|uniref:hypothetical protein n=1 Tax=Caldilinea sp. TaxID=2293560 RepID=UPI002D0C5DFA|nr:hypothetical protein [Anaerolineales bacterium]HQY90441.1 hypothetical protein [Caldilinea sp.]HRA65926.1 hypothetical protein [Caldilinea sp.]